MDGNGSVLIHKMASNYQVFLADFPQDLKPDHLEVPTGEQGSLFTGLQSLHMLIGNIYAHFANLSTNSSAPDSKRASERWKDQDYCHRAIEGPVKLLWALGSAGKITQGPDRLDLLADRTDLDQALKNCGVRDPAAAFGVLELLGIQVDFRDKDGLPCSGGYKRCVSVAVHYPSGNEPLLRALAYVVPRLPKNKATRKGTIFEIFLRADFRPLLPGYTIHIPHLPSDEGEVVRTFSLENLTIWNAITGFMTSHYPEYRLFFRIPRIPRRGWVADYSTKDDDYGAWSINIEEDGISVRIVFNNQALPTLLGHIPELSPQFQESYLTAVRCKDCIRCGKHVFYTHGDHEHRLCKSPWFVSPHLRLEDMPDIEHLVAWRLGNGA